MQNARMIAIWLALLCTTVQDTGYTEGHHGNKEEHEGLTCEFCIWQQNLNAEPIFDLSKVHWYAPRWCYQDGVCIVCILSRAQNYKFQRRRMNPRHKMDARSRWKYKRLFWKPMELIYIISTFDTLLTWQSCYSLFSKIVWNTQFERFSPYLGTYTDIIDLPNR